MRQQYIGDGVYVEHDGYQLILTAENGIQVLETIYLDPDVFSKLVAYKKLMENKGELPG